MRELIIGADGFVGSALRRHLPEADTTTRRVGAPGHYLDLLDVRELPPCDVAYICAGRNGGKACEGSQEAFVINVDAPIQIARLVTAQGGFCVHISSMSVEWTSTAYQRQKLAVETALRTMRGVGVVRAGRVLKTNIDDLCETLIRVGRNRVECITRWGTDDIAYAK